MVHCKCLLVVVLSIAFYLVFSDVVCLDLTWHLIMLQNYITANCWINSEHYYETTGLFLLHAVY